MFMPQGALPQESITISLDDKTLEIHSPVIDDNTLSVKDFRADLILSNNDFTAGLPVEFESVAQRIIPAPALGWHSRLKSDHFSILQKLIADFATQFSFDPWLIMPDTRVVSDVTVDDLSSLAAAVDEALSQIQKKHDEYGITDPPYVFVKNDSGTYGLGVMSVFSSDELNRLNRKARSRLFSAKAGSTQQNRFLVQEGIPTDDTYSGFPIEPVIYGVGKNPVGGFFRIHEGRNQFESLNTPGMSFACLCLHKIDEPHEASFINCMEKEKLVDVSKFVSRFASLAAAIEGKQN
jgi:glutamate--cysteine ligase